MAGPRAAERGGTGALTRLAAISQLGQTPRQPCPPPTQPWKCRRADSRWAPHLPALPTPSPPPGAGDLICSAKVARARPAPAAGTAHAPDDVVLSQEGDSPPTGRGPRTDATTRRSRRRRQRPPTPPVRAASAAPSSLPTGLVNRSFRLNRSKQLSMPAGIRHT